MRGLMERLFRSRTIRLVLSLVLMALLVSCSTKEEMPRGDSGEMSVTNSDSLEIAGGHADVVCVVGDAAARHVGVATRAARPRVGG